MIPFLLRFFSQEEYVALVVIGSLEGWFLLFDIGIGASLQNYLSECRIKKEPDAGFLKTAAIFICLSLGIGSFCLWIASPVLSSFLLGRYLSVLQAREVFLIGSFYLLLGVFGSLSFKILLARHKGYLFYAIQAVITACSLLCLLKDGYAGDLTLKRGLFFLYGLPSLSFSFMTLFFLFKIDWQAKIRFDLLKRGLQFSLFSFLAALVTLSDALIAPRILQVESMIEYNLLCKIFGVASFGFGAFVQGFFPECSELLALGDFKQVQEKLRQFCQKSFWGLFLFTVLIFLFTGVIEKLTSVRLSFYPIALFGIYLSIRAVSDFYAMALQSHSRLNVFFLLVPIQAIISLTFQYFLADLWGISGLLIALCLSYLLTVFWALPYKLKALKGLADAVS